MLKILDYKKWLNVYRSEIRTITAELNSEKSSYSKDVAANHLPFRLVTELHSAHHIGQELQEIKAIKPEELQVIDIAYEEINDQVKVFISKVDDEESFEGRQSRFSAFTLMLIENPISLMLNTVGQVQLQVLSRYGSTKITIEKSGKTLTARILHRQISPTFIYAFPESLENSGWESNYGDFESDQGSVSSFQAIISRKENNPDDSLALLVKDFTSGLGKSLHNEGNHNVDEGIKIYLDHQDEMFDKYLRVRSYWIHKLWMHHFLHITLNGYN